MGGNQGAHVGALTMILPGGVHGDGTVGVQLGVSLRGVHAVQAAAIHAGCYTDAVLVAAIGGGVFLSDPLLASLVQGTGLLVHLFQAVDVGLVAGGDGGLSGLLVAVQLTDVEGIESHLGSQHVNGDFGAHEGLGRAVSTEGGAPCVVGKDGLALVADGGDVVARADKLAQAVRQQVAELGVRTVVNVVVAPQTQQLALLVSRQLDVHEGGAALAGVGDVLELVEDQGYGLAQNLGSRTQNGLVGGRELVAEGAAGVVLDNAQLLHGNADAVGDHGHMQVDTDGLRVHGDHAVLVNVGVAAVGLQMQVGLTGAVGLDFHHVGSGVKVEVGTLDTVGLVVGVGSAGMNFDGVLGNGVHGVHVGGQLFDVHDHGVSGGTGVGLGVGGNDGDGVTELEDLLVTQDRTIPAVALVVQRQHDQTVDAVLAAGGHDVLGSDNLLNAGHLLGLGGINALNQSVADLGLNQSQTQGALGHLQSVVRAEVPGTGDLLSGGGTDVLGAHDGVAGGLEDQVFLGDLATDHTGSVHNGVH